MVPHDQERIGFVCPSGLGLAFSGVQRTAGRTVASDRSTITRQRSATNHGVGQSGLRSRNRAAARSSTGNRAAFRDGHRELAAAALDVAGDSRAHGRALSDQEFHEVGDDAVRLAVDSQLKAGVDVVTDGEQRRDSYASFVGGLLDGCQLIPITDLLPYVDDPVKFEAELRALDVPAGSVRHPAVFGPIRRSRPLAVHEIEFAKTLTDRTIKVALPGPYLLTRTMWMNCITDRAYETREKLADDVVRVLREELQGLLAEGAVLVQFDEPVLTEVVFGQPVGNRSFMCGALSEKLGTAEELAFAGELINRVIEGFPRDRTALHICRGNWTRDESVALAGSYEPLVPLLRSLKVGTFFLELCTPRAGEIDVLANLPDDCRIGVGVVNQKLDLIESVEEILAKAEAAIRVFGPHRVLLNPDCGFATFADNPVASAQVATAKLAAMMNAARQLRTRYKVESP